MKWKPCKVNIFSLFYEPFENFLCSLGQVLLPVVNYNLIWHLSPSAIKIIDLIISPQGVLSASQFMFPSIFNRIRFMKTFLASLGGLVNVKSENSSFECWRENLFAFYEVEAVLKLVEWWVLNVVININIRQKQKKTRRVNFTKVNCIYILPIYEVKACNIFHFSKCLGPPNKLFLDIYCIAWLPVGKYRAESI